MKQISTLAEMPQEHASKEHQGKVPQQRNFKDPNHGLNHLLPLAWTCGQIARIDRRLSNKFEVCANVLVNLGFFRARF